MCKDGFIFGTSEVGWIFKDYLMIRNEFQVTNRYYLGVLAETIYVLCRLFVLVAQGFAKVNIFVQVFPVALL